MKATRRKGRQSSQEPRVAPTPPPPAPDPYPPGSVSLGGLELNSRARSRSGAMLTVLGRRSGLVRVHIHRRRHGTWRLPPADCSLPPSTPVWPLDD